MKMTPEQFRAEATRLRGTSTPGDVLTAESPIRFSLDALVQTPEIALERCGVRLPRHAVYSR